MDVNIKDLNMPLSVGNTGTIFQVKMPKGGKHVGYLVINKTGVTWLNGKAPNGKIVEWNDLIKFINENGK